MFMNGLDPKVGAFSSYNPPLRFFKLGILAKIDTNRRKSQLRYYLEKDVLEIMGQH